MLPPIRRSHSSSGGWSGRLSSLLSSTSPILLCLALILALFLFVTAATSLPSYISSRAGFARKAGELDAAGKAVAAGAALLSLRRSAPSPAILQWEKAQDAEAAEAGGLGGAPAVAPAGGAPLAAPPTAVSALRPRLGDAAPLPQQPHPPPPPPPPPLVIKPHHESVEKDDSGVWSSHADAIKAAFVHAYSHYENKCFGQDEYRPVHHTRTLTHAQHTTRTSHLRWRAFWRAAANLSVPLVSSAWVSCPGSAITGSEPASPSSVSSSQYGRRS